MTDQPKQLDMFAGEAKRDEALANVQRGAETWVARVIDLIRMAPRGTELTTDGLWVGARALGLKVAEPRAMGAALNNARKLGLVEATGVYRKSERPECHARPILVWRRR